jgi:hypothetical protein
MKIRHPLAIKFISLVGAWLLRLWMATIRYRYRPLGPNLEPSRTSLPGRFIYALWHENMLLPTYHYAKPNIRILISQHADGEVLAEVCKHLRVGTIRGSTSRGGVEAVRQMLRASRRCHLAMVPDGPRGPRRRVQSGLIYLAARTGLPIVIMGVGYARPWRLKTWDHFAIPRPWSLATIVTAQPISIPADADKEQLESYRQFVEDSLHWANELAERWAETGKFHVSRPQPQWQASPVRKAA